MERVKLAVRQQIRIIASWVDRLSAGKITPSQVTVFGLIAHLPIAWLIVDGQLVLAGLLLIVFGLMDTLDGELARLQKRTSLFGGFLDSTADRAKEVMLYAAIGYSFALQSHPEAILLAILVLGVSFLTSYMNAAGDVAARQTRKSSPKSNQTFRNGLGGFEVRMALLVVGLLFNILLPTLALIGLLGLQTVWLRFNKVRRLLADA